MAVERVNTRPVLLAVVELGGYPNFAPLYHSLGYEVVTAQAGRKAMSSARELRPAAVVAEFNYQREFRDRTSALESLLATLQKQQAPRVIVFYDRSVEAELQSLRARFPGFTALSYPVEAAALEAALRPTTLSDGAITEVPKW